MQTQTIFQAGNSEVVAIPKHLMKELNFKNGQKVVVDKTSDGEAIVIKKLTKSSSKSFKRSNEEYNKWLDLFMKENGEILDELAVR